LQRAIAANGQPLGQRRHDHRQALLGAGDLEPVADGDLPRRLDAGAAHLHVAAEDGLGRRASRLEEARRPEPLVDAYAFHALSLWLLVQSRKLTA
jgi:hypothetical protein